MEEEYSGESVELAEQLEEELAEEYGDDSVEVLEEQDEGSVELEELLVEAEGIAEETQEEESLVSEEWVAV